MLLKPAATVLLVTGCIAAASGGAYVAFRQNGSAPAAVSAPDNSNAAKEAAPASVVRESEALVQDDHSTPAAESNVPTSTPAPGNAKAAAPVSAAKPSPSRAASSRPTETVRAPARSNSTPATSTNRPPAESTTARVEPDPRQYETLSAPAPSTDAPPVRPDPASSAPSRRTEIEIAPPPQPPEPTFEEVVISADSVIGLQLDTTVSSERAKVEDRVDARVTRDVMTGSRVVIPAGSKMIGSVSLVEKGGKLKERARLGIRFHTLVLADGTELAVHTGTLYRDGDSPARKSAAKIGGAAVGGAILGAIMGGGRGAVVGGTVGAAGGTAAVMAGDKEAATLPAGTTVTVQLSDPVTVTVPK